MSYLDEAISIVRLYCPKFKVVSKEDSLLHRTIGKIMFFNPGYMKNFYTTIGYTAATPIGIEASYEVIYHEGLHAIQAKKYTRLLFGLAYLLPQILAPLFVALSFIFSLWLLIPAAVLLLPLPAYFRMKFELEAYCLSAMIEVWKGKYTDESRNFIINNFIGENYYFMWPFKKRLISAIDSAVLKAKSWDPVSIRNDSYLESIYNSMRFNGLVAVNKVKLTLV